jgi:hypothetical protein
MGFLNKLGIGLGAAPSREIARPIHSNGRSSLPPTSVAIGATRVPERTESARISNGLKELLWNLDGLGRGTLLDLGPAWQTTLSFFIERGFRVSSDDLLRDWKGFMTEEETRLREDASVRDTVDMTPAGRAARFLSGNLEYAKGSFDAILLWDLLDYLEPSLAKQLAARLTDLLRTGGVVFAMFHSRKPEAFQRYRVADSNTLQVVSAPTIFAAQKIYQNREIQEMFSRYRTMRSFVGRDQLRETLFIK